MTRKVEIISRDQVKKEDSWDLEVLFKSEDEWSKSCAWVESYIPQLAGYKNRLNVPDVIFEFFGKLREVEITWEKVYLYAMLKKYEDMGDEKAEERVEKLKEVERAFLKAVSFMDSELLAKDKALFDELCGQERFSSHHFYFRKLQRQKEHILSVEEEELLGQVSQVFIYPKNVFGKFSNVDLSYKPVSKKDSISGKLIKLPLTSGSYMRMMEDEDRSVRRQAAKNKHTAYGAYRSTLAECLSSHVNGNKIKARIRKYPTTLSMFLDPKAISEEVYKALFEATNSHLHLLQRYALLRKKVLGLKRLYWYDLYVPLLKGAPNNYSYDEAVEMTLASVELLGSEYHDALSQGLKKDRWVDKFENKNKRSGAFSFGMYETLPYILHNYSGTLNSVYTLAHEAGHSMHSKLACANQPYELHEYGIFLAEIASTTNEQLLSHYLLQGADRKLKLFIINRQLENIRATFFRQTMFAEFEHMLYSTADKGKALSANMLEEYYMGLNERYYGRSVTINDYIKHEWSRIPHFYMNFYVYQYATGIACALYFSDKIISGGRGDMEDYLKVLKAGGSDYPTEILKKHGLDVCEPDYINALMRKFEYLLVEFEDLL